MKFRVRWEEKALDELAQAWLQSESGRRKLITRATAEIDQQWPLCCRRSGSGGAQDPICPAAGRNISH
jgi:hypothetical protein